MNETNGFKFYRNYYELTKYLPDKERLQIYDSILGYMFEDIEPELSGLCNGIWINFKMPLDTSKNNIENGKKGGAPKGNDNAKKTTEKQPKNNRKTTESTTEKQPNNISTFLFLLSNFNFLNNNNNLKNKIEDWLKYKWERTEYYKETGFKTLLARIDSATSQYGVEEVLNLIDECMANNYKGIIFEKLNGIKGKKVSENVPDWFDKEVKKKEISKEDKKKIEEMLKEFM